MSCSRLSTFLTATSMRAKLLAHRVARLHAVEAAAVGVAAPRLVDGGEVGVVVPAAGLEQLRSARAVGARLGAEDARGRAPPRRVLAELGHEAVAIGERVLARRSCRSAGSSSAGDQRHGVVEQVTRCREGVAEEARDAHGDVDARAPELLQRDRARARPRGASRGATAGARRAGRGSRRRRRPGCASPPCPTRRSRPSRDARRPRRGGGAAARRPAGARRRRRGRLGSALRVDRVEVAPGRQHVDAPARRRARRPGGHVAAAQRRRAAWSSSSVVARRRGTTPRRRSAARSRRRRPRGRARRRRSRSPSRVRSRARRRRRGARAGRRGGGR